MVTRERIETVPQIGLRRDEGYGAEKHHSIVWRGASKVTHAVIPPIMSMTGGAYGAAAVKFGELAVTATQTAPQVGFSVFAGVSLLGVALCAAATRWMYGLLWKGDGTKKEEGR